MMRTDLSIASLTLIAVLTLPLALAGQAADPWIGTWKLDVAASKYDPGRGPRSQTLTIEQVAGGQKHTFDGINDKGQKTHAEQVTRYDGAETPIVVSGEAPPPEGKRTNTFRRVDARSFEVIGKRDGKVIVTTRVVSADGKTMTQTATGTNAEGAPVHNVIIYRKQ
jgi:hypothetical protein